MMAADAVFVDTNLLVFATFDRAPWHAARRRVLEDLHASGRTLWVSRQVLRECLVQLTRPQSFGTIPHAIGAAAVEALAAQFTIADENVLVSTMLIQLVKTHGVSGKQVHDANIVATMMVHQVPTLVSWNGRDFRRYGSLIDIIEP